MSGKLDAQQAKLARTLKEEVSGQVKLWQKVPYLALQADGRSSWSPFYSDAYRFGLWRPAYQLPGISEAKVAEYPSIDCATGRFVLVGSRNQILCEVLDSALLMPFLGRDIRHLLKAGEVVSMLRTTAKRPVSSTVGVAENVENLREHYRELYNVKPVFTRG